MIKIWAKVIKDQKMQVQFVLKKQEPFLDEKFHSYLMEICKQLDLETPIVLRNHLSNFKEFKSVKFLKDDFLEQIEFDYLLLEDISN
jgi:hypothetical protein